MEIEEGRSVDSGRDSNTTKRSSVPRWNLVIAGTGTRRRCNQHRAKRARMMHGGRDAIGARGCHGARNDIERDALWLSVAVCGLLWLRGGGG